MRSSRFTLAVITCLCSFTAALWLSAAVAAATPPSGAVLQNGNELPDAMGRDVAVRVCGPCHAATLITERMRTREEWKLTIDNMASYGAEATEAEFDEVLKYAVSVAGKVNVNTAPAAELAPVLDVSPDVAAAVEKYRGEHGKFASIDDLKKVPGVDAQKLDGRKNRLQY
jgi:competence protein ComEA